MQADFSLSVPVTFLSTSYFLAQKGFQAPLYFLALESAVSPRSPVFLQWRMVFTNQDSAGALMAAGASFLLGPRDEHS